MRLRIQKVKSLSSFNNRSEPLSPIEEASLDGSKDKGRDQPKYTLRLMHGYLSKRTINSLIRSGVHSPEHLIRLSETDLMMVRNFGPKSIAEVKAFQDAWPIIQKQFGFSKSAVDVPQVVSTNSRTGDHRVWDPQDSLGPQTLTSQATIPETSTAPVNPPSISAGELVQFLNDLGSSHTETLTELPPDTIDAFLMAALRDVDLIGELPVSEEAFNVIEAILRREYIEDGRPRLGRIKPALLMVSMVFCARYSRQNARTFWEPYAQLVWGMHEANGSFQIRARYHFAKARTYLEKQLSILGREIGAGDVVKAVYRHAVVPYYFQDDLARWLVANYKNFWSVTEEELPFVLEHERSLDHTIGGLRTFMRSEETREAAAALTSRLVRAIELYLNGEDYQAVAALMVNPIEQSLWYEIGTALAEKTEREQIRRRPTPRLEWIWSLEEHELSLRLLNLTLDPNKCPTVCVWTNDAKHLLRSDVVEYVNPWQNEDGSYYLDEVVLNNGPLNGQVYILSEDHDDDVPDILYHAPVPSLPESPLGCSGLRNRVRWGYLLRVSAPSWMTGIGFWRSSRVSKCRTSNRIVSFR